MKLNDDEGSPHQVNYSTFQGRQKIAPRLQFLAPNLDMKRLPFLPFQQPL